MAIEAPVLVGEQQIEEARIDIGAGGRQTPATLRSGVGPQQRAVAINHQRRKCQRIAQRYWSERDNPPRGRCEEENR
jgi:hypothetical protein